MCEALAPGETLVPYYLGLIALKREDNASGRAAGCSSTRAKTPKAPRSREMCRKTLTLLSSAQLQQEVAECRGARDAKWWAAPPEPGSIAVQAFVNKGSSKDEGDFRAMAKGLAAMIIADLSQGARA